MRKKLLANTILIPTSVALLTTSCAVNPKTGKMELSPAVQQTFSSIGQGVSNIYNNPDPCSNNARNLGITLGVLAGAVIGHSQSDNKQGALIGAALGGAIGGAIGHNVDKRRCELYKVAQANALTMATKSITDQSLGQTTQDKAKANELGMNLILKDDGKTFETGSAELTPRGRNVFGQMAQVYAKDKADKSTEHRKVLIIAHADEGMDAQEAFDLSEARAKAVAKLFAKNGVDPRDIYFQGAGDSMPVADNNTEDGRADNRRIQIVDLPNTADLQKYLQLRTTNPNNFKIAAKTPKAATKPIESKPDSKGERNEKELTPSVQAAAPKQPVPQKSTRSKSESAGSRTLANYNFGGEPYDQTAALDLGSALDSSVFSFISNANAAEHVVVRPCIFDSPRSAGSVQNLQTGEDLNPERSIADAIPGLHDQPIMGSVNGHFILVVHPYAAKDSAVKTPKPTLEVFKDYQTNKKNYPDFKEKVPVNVYRGKDATLYRMFVNGPMQCMDLVVDSKNPKIEGKIYYTQQGSEYVAVNPMSLKKLVLN